MQNFLYYLLAKKKSSLFIRVYKHKRRNSYFNVLNPRLPYITRHMAFTLTLFIDKQMC
jgi:hypothetical protein